MTEGRPTLSTGLSCRDPRAEILWLEKAFGFETTMIVEMDDGSIGHSELRLGDGLIMVGSEWDERHRSPTSLNGVNTQSIHVELKDGLEAHYERAKAAGAVIIREPADQFYGDRVYGCVDPEGHIWTFSQPMRTMTIEEMNAEGGRQDSREALSLDRTLAALADPQRRRTVDLLSRGPRAAGDLARSLDIPPPAMSRHLKTLKESGLVRESHPAFDARVRVYALETGPMTELADWLRQTEAPVGRRTRGVQGSMSRRRRTRELAGHRGHPRPGDARARLQRVHRGDWSMVAAQCSVRLHATRPGRAVVRAGRGRAADRNPIVRQSVRGRKGAGLGAAG